MTDADLAFEKSEVEATVTTPVISIKNPLRGRIEVQKVNEIINDNPESGVDIIITSKDDE